MSWLLVFSGYRRLFEDNVVLRTECKNALSHIEQQTAELEKLRPLPVLLSQKDLVIQQLGQQLELALARPMSQPTDLLKDFQDRVLQEVPFPGGSIPEAFWLTPGADDTPVKRDDGPTA